MMTANYGENRGCIPARAPRIGHLIVEEENIRMPIQENYEITSPSNKSERFDINSTNRKN